MAEVHEHGLGRTSEDPLPKLGRMRRAFASRLISGQFASHSYTIGYVELSAALDGSLPGFDPYFCNFKVEVHSPKPNCDLPPHPDAFEQPPVCNVISPLDNNGKPHRVARSVINGDRTVNLVKRRHNSTCLVYGSSGCGRCCPCWKTPHLPIHGPRRLNVRSLRISRREHYSHQKCHAYSLKPYFMAPRRSPINCVPFVREDI